MPKPVRTIRRYHVHWPGVFAIGLTVLLMIGAVNSQNNLLFIVFGILLSAILISGIISGTMLMGISAARAPTPIISAGEPGELEYIITNRSRFMPAFALLIRETGARGDRARPLPALAPCVRARRTLRVRARIEPMRRGVVALTGIEVSSSFPFGVFRKSIRLVAPGELVVAPAVRPIPAADLAAIRGNRRAAAASRPRAGNGLDFFGLRDYVPGDSPKRLAWKAWARTDQMVVHQATDEPSRSLRIALAIDIADGDDACERAISEAASLTLAAVDEGILAELILASGGLRIIAEDQRIRTKLLGAMARIDTSAPDRGSTGSSLRGADVIVVASGPRGRAKAPTGRVWSVAR